MVTSLPGLHLGIFASAVEQRWNKP